MSSASRVTLCPAAADIPFSSTASPSLVSVSEEKDRVKSCSPRRTLFDSFILIPSDAGFVGYAATFFFACSRMISSS